MDKTLNRLDMCCAYSVAVQDNPIFKGKRLYCGTCGREVVYPDNGTGWEYVPEVAARREGEVVDNNNDELDDEPMRVPCCMCGRPTTIDTTYGDLCYRCCRADNE